MNRKTEQVADTGLCYSYGAGTSPNARPDTDRENELIVPVAGQEQVSFFQLARSCDGPGSFGTMGCGVGNEGDRGQRSSF